MSACDVFIHGLRRSSVKKVQNSQSWGKTD